jgi:hypothetical protein
MESSDMLRHSTLLALAAIVTIAVPARAQVPPGLPVATPPGQGAPPIVRPGQPPSPGGIGRPQIPKAGTISLELESVDVGKPVLNAPYSAEAVTEVIQTLADGNRIEQRTSAIVARDSRGRTRREQHGIALGALVARGDSPIVTITDPATGTSLNLNQDAKVALRSRSVAGSFPPVPSSGARIETTTEDDGFATDAASPEVRTRKLGTKEVEGIRVEGTETTVTIRAGAMGNRLPIRLVSERWLSPELKVVVMSRRIDPRFGETRFQLTNIVRGEPPAHLFEVPSDFRIEDRKQPPAKPIRPDEEG